ncbi:cell division protein FtsA [Campylobacter corcagiensis]|uniref:Cell division protein FtsA n=1 Tax=Campylobacter corcagiensis TaxID=1448857 RepID=A0A7M1LE16_9BACT|nr:cell division protein FtsA [Campylobacter corcagiensis]QKF65061.1 cell division protein FtsA [Campylobacter corcagiensis]QOQ86788.1 cell division protein FtsA [Campylobacter corcagiensis]
MNNCYILGLDVGSVNVTATIAKIDNDNFSVCGIGKAKTSGLKKGVVTNIEKAAISIRKAVAEAKKSAGTRPDKTVVSISGAYAKSVSSQGIVSIPNDEITINEIKRAMQMAKDNARLEKEQIILHVLPYEFKVDGQEFIEDPIGMSGSRLEVCVHVVTAEENSVRNLLKATQMAGLKIDSMVLSGYASAISTLNKDEKELGVALIDIGGATSDLIVHLGNSIRYNGVVPFGSANITMDLSHALSTPLKDAEDLKLEYTKLLHSGVKELNLPTIGESSKTHPASLDIVTNVIYARIEEILLLLVNDLEKSGYLKNGKLGAGVVLTGGMAKLDDIRNLTSLVFDNMPVRVAKPRMVAGLYEISDDPENACSLGLCLYGAGEFTAYEIDSNGELKYKDAEISTLSKQSVEINDTENRVEKEVHDIDKNFPIDISKISKNKDEISIITKFKNWITQLF